MSYVYTDEQIDFLNKFSTSMSRTELTDKFNEKFGTCRTKCQIQDYCARHKIIGRSRRIRQKKYKIGDECFLAGEWRIVISTEQKIPILKRTEYKKRVIWQQKYGNIPSNHLLIYLDGDKKNCTLENLALVPILWMRILNQNGWLNGNVEVTKSALKWCELHYSLSKKYGNRYVKQNGQRYR